MFKLYQTVKLNKLNKFIVFSIFSILLANIASAYDINSMRGKIFKLTVESASGLYATQGEFLLIVSKTDDTYKIRALDEHVVDSNGKYDLQIKEDEIYFLIQDDGFPDLIAYVQFNFKTNYSGSYKAVVEGEYASHQIGKFVELVPAQ